MGKDNILPDNNTHLVVVFNLLQFEDFLGVCGGKKEFAKSSTLLL